MKTGWVAPADNFKQVSLRHLSEDADGNIWIAGQYEGDRSGPFPVVAVCVSRRKINFIEYEEKSRSLVKNYAGSITVNPLNNQVAVTFPRDNRALLFDSSATANQKISASQDICGVVTVGKDFIFSNGRGDISTQNRHLTHHEGLAFDNHLALSSAWI